MKNYLKITMGLVLASMIVSCSDEDNTIVPDTNPDPVIPTEGTFILPAPAVESNIPEHSFLMGALFSYQKNLRNGEDAASGGTSSTTFYNKPLFEVKSFGATETEWWDNLVEEMVYSGLDYVAPNCRGRLPKADTDPAYDRDHGDPTRIKDFIAALQRRNEENLKIAIFDDCPASWAAARNFDLYQTYATFISAEIQQSKGLTDEEVMYPLDNLDDIYKYIWDYNIKLAFDNFYGENKANNKYLLRIDGKPVLFLWSINGFLNVDYAALGNKKIDCKGKLKAILNKIHADFKSAYGEDLFICADRAFQDRDKEVDESVVESLNDWFIASEQAPTRSSWTVRTFNGKTVGVAVPAFYTNDKSGTRMFFDADHGKRLTDALDDMVAKNADLVFLEGFTDMAENAAYWRSTDNIYYDFPNQRLNILRKYSSSRAWAESFRVEMEACDYFFDVSAKNSGNQYRTGSLDVAKIAGVAPDKNTEWYVTSTEAGEWMEWKELPYTAGDITVKVCYAAKEDAKIRFDFGEGTKRRQGPVVELPATGGEWVTVDAFTMKSDVNGWRRTVLNIVAGKPDLNYFTITVEK